MLDADVFPEVRGLLIKLRFQVIRSVDVLAQDAPDRAVLKYADEQSALLVTRNQRHFQRLVGKRPPEGNQQRYRRASVLYFTCANEHCVVRLAACLDVFRWELNRARKRPDGRVFAVISATGITVHR